MMKTLLAISTIVLLASLAVATVSQNPDLEKYQFGFLKRGPNWNAENTPEVKKIQEGHMANINKMAKAGKLLAAGPIADEGEIRGIFIFKAASLEEAKSLAAEDPAIKSGRLTLEIRNWFGPKGIGAKIQDEMKTNPNPKFTMTKYYLVLLKRGPKPVDVSTPEGHKLLMEHLSNMKKMMAARTFLAAGSFEGKEDLQGIFVVTAASPEEAKTIVDADPAVKAGDLTAEIHPWYVASEVWP
jgi:uncharacterized protein YciI